jgi:hypothetical protein
MIHISFAALRRASLLCAIAIALPLTSEAQRQPRAVAGTYTTTVSSPQGDVKAVILLKKEGAAFTGTLAAEGFPTLPVVNVVPSDTGVTLDGDSPDGPVNVSLKFGDGDKVTGKVVYQGLEMVLAGTFAAGDAMNSVAGPAMDPVGVYTVTSEAAIMGEASLTVRCTVTKAGDSHGGMCGTDAGEAPIGTVTVAGNTVTVGGESPAGPYKIVMTVANGAVTGTMAIGAESSKLKGTHARL